MTPDWTKSYIEGPDGHGLPFKEKGRDRNGVDCWGLLRIVYAEQLGLTVPSYTEDYRTTDDEREISQLIQRELGPWRPVAIGAGEQTQPFDMVMFRMRGVPMHIGVMIAWPRFLHVHEGINTCLERVDSMRWSQRIVGVYRHQARMNQGVA